MVHPEIMSLLASEHIETLRAAGRPWRSPARAAAPQARTADVELRLCKVGDDPELERLAALDGRTLPAGRFVVAAVDGRISAALPLGGGPVIADPFVHTGQLLPLLELRAAQLRGPELRRGLPRRYVSLMRGSTHA